MNEQSKLNGLYYCPICKRYLERELLYQREQLHVIVRLTNNQMFHSQTLHCPDCQRPMWLSKAVNRNGDLVFDTYQSLYMKHT